MSYRLRWQGCLGIGVIINDDNDVDDDEDNSDDDDEDANDDKKCEKMLQSEL